MTLSEPYSFCLHAVPGLDAGPVPLTEHLPGMFRILQRKQAENGAEKCQ